MPSSTRHLQAFRPSRVVGNFTTIFLCQLAYSRPSLHIAPASVSAFTGPSTTEQISRMVSLKVLPLPSFAISDGLVVTPSRMPSEAASRISLMLAVSRKNFIAAPGIIPLAGSDFPLQLASLKKIDESELSNHQPHNRNENTALSVVYADDASEAMQPEQFSRPQVAGWNDKPTLAFDV